MKKNLRKAAVLLMTVLMMSALFAACSKQEEEPNTGVPNPWQETDSAEAAAEGAGIEALSIADGIQLGLGEVKVSKYRYMDGMIEALIEFPASQLTVRKGRPDTTTEKGDISGDYNDYKSVWSQGINQINVKCEGNQPEASTKTTWQNGDYLYSINALGLGGEEDFGLSMEDLSLLVGGLQ